MHRCCLCCVLISPSTSTVPLPSPPLPSPPLPTAMRPRFFNLRPVKMRTLGEEPPEEEDSTFAEVCHSVILSYCGPDGQDYTDFHQSIVFLFGSVLQSSGGHFEGSPFQKVLVSDSPQLWVSCREMYCGCYYSSRHSIVSSSHTTNQQH